MSTDGRGDAPSERWRARWIWCEQPRIEPSELSPLARVARSEAVYGCFRRRLHLDAVPAQVPVRLTTDSRYVLWVNGVEVSRGPLRSNLRRLRYDRLDLAEYLEPGDNLIAILACFFGRPTPWWAPVPAAMQLGAGAVLFEAQLGDEWITSDASWRCLTATAWSEGERVGIGGMAPELHDARLLPARWRQREFDDSEWAPATELYANSLGFSGRHQPPSHPYGPLLPRPIAFLSKVERWATPIYQATAGSAGICADPVDQVLADNAEAQPARIERGMPLQLPPGVHVATFDFGEIVAGTVVVELDAAPGTQLDVAATEFADADGRVTVDEERNGFRYIARGADDVYETFRPFGCRYLGISVRGDGPVTVRRVGINERLYPRLSPAADTATAKPARFLGRQEELPFFECSDPLLNQIWAVGRRSVDLNSTDAYTDCPTREQRAWTGDFVVHQMVDLTTHLDWRLARWNVELCASPRVDGMLPMAAGGDIEYFDSAYIPDWALHWVRALHNLYRYSGDRELIARLLPVAEGVLRWFVPFQAEDGLLADVTGWVIIDWSSVSVGGKSSVLNALWARALRDFAEMAEWLGDGGRAAWARRSYATVAAGFEAFWDRRRELYVDHIDGGEWQLPYSQHAQAAPLAAGLVAAERAARLLEVMLDRERWVHATWSRAGADARTPGPGESGVGGPYLIVGPPPPWWDVERQMVVAQPFFRYVVHDAVAAAGRPELISALCRDWGELLDRCSTSWSETWYGGTVSHGWGSTPTRDLMMYTLGVTPAQPGFTRARIAPRLGDLDWVRGAVPTPFGLIRVQAGRDEIAIESPVAFELTLREGESRQFTAGAQRVRVSRS